MTEQNVTALKKQTAILVGVNTNQADFSESMEELANLADASAVEVVGQITQNLERPVPKFYVGKGKLEEIIALLEETEADMVIFNDELSPSQLRNIEKVVEAKIIDRTILILEIFSIRAQTKEAQLQIAIAQLQYFLPRLVGLRASLGRQAGGGGSGSQNKGLGEQKIELDRRKIKNEILMLEKELKSVVSERKTQRKWRKKQNIKTVALVGYTNAGKSSVMNLFLQEYRAGDEKEVFSKDMLFATLETTARRIDLPRHQSFLLTDTVGFVNRLPHNLIEAFKSTLEEIKEADVLLHVVDSSSPRKAQMIKTTEETLTSLGADAIPTIYLYNKADLLTENELTATELTKDALFFSTITGQGFDALMLRIKQLIFTDYQTYSLLIPYDRGDITAHYHEHVEIVFEDYEELGTRLHIFATEQAARKFHKDVLEVNLLENN